MLSLTASPDISWQVVITRLSSKQSGLFLPNVEHCVVRAGRTLRNLRGQGLAMACASSFFRCKFDGRNASDAY